MEFIKPNLVYCPRLSISQDHGLANKLGLSVIEFCKDDRRSGFGGWHRATWNRLDDRGRLRKRATRDRRMATGCHGNPKHRSELGIASRSFSRKVLAQLMQQACRTSP